MTIGGLARACGVGVETIRYYERRGLIPDPRPRGVGQREFTDEDVRRVRFIKQAQGLGFTLKEIADLLALRVSRQTPCGDVRELAQAKLKDIDEKLRTLRSFKRALERLVDECERSGPTGSCPIIDALNEPGAREERSASQSRGGAK